MHVHRVCETESSVTTHAHVPCVCGRTGEVIYEQGAVSKEIYFLLKGEVLVLSRSREVCACEDGSQCVHMWVGEMLRRKAFIHM